MSPHDPAPHEPADAALGGAERERIVDVAAGGCTCRAADDFAPALAELLRKGLPDRWPGLSVVKSSTVRTVLAGEVALPSSAARWHVHVKLFRRGRLTDRAREAWRGARGRRELELLLEARRRGLPCVRPLAAGTVVASNAVGDDPGHGLASFLVTATAAGAALPRGPLPRGLAAAAGALLRRAHDRGLHARDLHAANLIAPADGSGPCLVDLTSAAFGDPLTRDERAAALALFCLDLDGNVRDPAAAPLLAAYGADADLIARAAQRGRLLRRRALLQFGRRASRACRHTQVEAARRGATWYLHVPAVDRYAAARRLVAALPQLDATKRGRRGGVWLDGELAAKERPAAAARRLWRAAYWLAYAGVPCPEPVALQVFRGRGIVVTQRLMQPTLAEELPTLGPVARLAVARALGTAVGRLHAHGLRNRDLKLDNLVRVPVAKSADDAAGTTGVRVHMVDLDGVRRKALHDDRGAAADLGRLLAAFRAHGAPGGGATLRAFLRSYNRALACLLHPPIRRWQLRLTEARASTWAARRERRAGS